MTEPILLVDGNRGIYTYQHLAKFASKELEDAILTEFDKSDWEYLKVAEPFESEEYNYIIEDLLNINFNFRGEECMLFSKMEPNHFIYSGGLWLYSTELFENEMD